MKSVSVQHGNMDGLPDQLFTAWPRRETPDTARADSALSLPVHDSVHNDFTEGVILFPQDEEGSNSQVDEALDGCTRRFRRG